MATGLISGQKVVAHHLFGKKRYKKFESSLFNGVLLAESIHHSYHNFVGWEGDSVNPYTFIDFLKILQNPENRSLLF